jgi:hypothetical protein
VPQADSYDQIYDFETALEEAFRTGLGTALVDIHVLTRKNAIGEFQEERPRVEIRVSLGAPSPKAHIHLIPELLEQHIDCYRFNLELLITTAPVGTEAQNTLHPQLRARTRRYMAAIEKTLQDEELLPYHEVWRMWPTGTEPIMRDEQNVEQSTLRYEGDVMIRPGAWPAEVAPEE